jgi:hypothetical protein
MERRIPNLALFRGNNRKEVKLDRANIGIRTGGGGAQGI